MRVKNEDQNDHLAKFENLLSVEDININVSQRVILITEDKIRLCVESYVKKSRRETGWIAPLGILLSALATLITANFKDFFLSASTWQAIFVLACIGAAGWLVWSLLVIRKKVTVDDLLKEIRTGNKDFESRDSGGSN